MCMFRRVAANIPSLPAVHDSPRRWFPILHGVLHSRDDENKPALVRCRNASKQGLHHTRLNPFQASGQVGRRAGSKQEAQAAIGKMIAFFYKTGGNKVTCMLAGHDLAEIKATSIFPLRQSGLIFHSSKEPRLTDGQAQSGILARYEKMQLRREVREPVQSVVLRVLAAGSPVSGGVYGFALVPEVVSKHHALLREGRIFQAATRAVRPR